ncbi:hypothetical protein F8M41_012445 [Gigaspora margarita]|uniref:Uncharacterized protein n=1 Tax=Gigaspora margarita TaxID=4874 RepID=A0A8H4A1X5_GIGMA|nr:hypothetical protein F8M41_012445 [Gigaspora margarita]
MRQKNINAILFIFALFTVGFLIETNFEAAVMPKSLFFDSKKNVRRSQVSSDHCTAVCWCWFGEYICCQWSLVC